MSEVVARHHESDRFRIRGRAPREAASMVLVPRDLNPGIPAIGPGHNLAPGRVPFGGGILTVFYMHEWSRQHWHDDDATLIETTVRAVNEFRPGWAADVRASHVTRWSPAVVARRPGTFVGLRDFAARRSARPPNTTRRRGCGGAGD